MWGKGDLQTSARLPGYIAGTAPATAVVTPTAVNAADTVTLNGQALTAIQQRGSGTVTAASVLAADTVTINGVVFTAVNGATTGNQFDMSGTNTQCAASLAAAINACVTAGILGVVGAKSAAAVCTVFAILPGTAGNSLPLVSSNGGRLAVSGATFAGGIAIANNQFDSIGSDTAVASSLADCINNSSTGIVQLAKASARSATITLASTTDGESVTIGNVTFTARNGATTDMLQFDVSGSDTADATALAAAINAHPYLSQYVLALSAAGVVTVYERPAVVPGLAGAASALSQNNSSYPTSANAIALAKSGAHITLSGAQIAAGANVLIEALILGAAGNAQTIASSNGARLPILNSATRLTGGTDSAVTF
jgi:hypothetical protein